MFVANLRLFYLPFYLFTPSKVGMFPSIPEKESLWEYDGPFSTMVEIHSFQFGLGVGFAVASPWRQFTKLVAPILGFDDDLDSMDEEIREQAADEPHYMLSGIVVGSVAGVVLGYLARNAGWWSE